jgi:glycolate oxidase FAD binding subunit
VGVGAHTSEADLAWLQERVRAAAAAGTPLAICGGGTKDFYGGRPMGEVLDVRGLTGIVDYDPTELVVTVRAGTRLAEVERTLREAGQMLACEPPHFGAAATIGGSVAAGLSGPRRPYGAALRDIVLGVRVVDGKGEDLAFGGRVMKNVAGFDVARLMTGALGTLGVLTEVSLKCVPVPKVESTCLISCSPGEALARMNEWGGKPLPLSATCYTGGVLAVRLSGAGPAVMAAVGKLGGSIADDAEAFWSSVREQTHRYFAPAREGGAPLWRLAVKSTAPYADLGGEQMVEWGGALRWIVAGESTDAERLRAWAAENGGHATLFRGADKSVGVFHPLPEALDALHRRLKANFDPSGVLNPGRLYPGF